MRQTGGAKTGLIALGVIGLVVVLGVVAVVGLYVTGNLGSSGSAAATTSHTTSPTTASPRSAPSATTAQPVVAPGKYAISAVANACDLVDSTPLKKWSSTPTAPVHMEDADGGSLLCQIQYTSTSATDGVTTNEAGIGLQVQLTGASGPAAYDGWKSTDTAPQQGWSSGAIAGLGAQSYWHAIGTTDTGSGGSYILGVQDSNISVRVEVAVHRARGEAPVNEHDLAVIAQSQARAVLDRLGKP